jgi:hypothetical protein
MEKELNWNKKNQIKYQKYNVKCTITRRLEDDVEYFTASNIQGLTLSQISDLNRFLTDDMDIGELEYLLKNLRGFGCRNEGFDTVLRYGDCKKTDKEPEPSRYKIEESNLTTINPISHYVFISDYELPPFISPFSIW